GERKSCQVQRHDNLALTTQLRPSWNIFCFRASKLTATSCLYLGEICRMMEVKVMNRLAPLAVPVNQHFLQTGRLPTSCLCYRILKSPHWKLTFFRLA
ncbi:hypothetical protein LDENG_00283120, partial [Lucifuga dentata]